MGAAWGGCPQLWRPKLRVRGLGASLLPLGQAIGMLGTWQLLAPRSWGRRLPSPPAAARPAGCLPRSRPSHPSLPICAAGRSR